MFKKAFRQGRSEVRDAKKIMSVTCADGRETVSASVLEAKRILSSPAHPPVGTGAFPGRTLSL